MTVLTNELTPSLKDLVALTKPKITIMTIIVALGGMLLAAEATLPLRALWGLLGIALLVSGSSVLNMYWERSHDRLMDRTKDRPLPSGRMQPVWALFLGILLSFLAMPVLLFGSNLLTAVLGVFSLVAYVFLYTPMKRISSLALVVGAFPGAMPVLLGYTAVSNKLDIPGLALFSLAFFWQLPHFIAITIYRKGDYTKAGYPVVAEVTGILAAKWLMFFTTVLLVLSSILIYFVHLGGLLYLYVSVLLGFWFLAETMSGFVTENVDAWSKRVFHVSLVYQLIIFAILAVDVLLKKFILNNF